jgi:hypothetical protein
MVVKNVGVLRVQKIPYRMTTRNRGFIQNSKLVFNPNQFLRFLQR